MANNRIQIKRTSTAARTPNTSDPANTQYIAPGELALNMTDKILYTSDGSSLITIGATQTTIQAATVNLTDNITIGDIGSSQLIVNSTAVFAGNNTVNSSVNTTAIAVRDPDHYSAIAADIIAVSNNSSNSKVTPALIFVGNSAANAQFNMIGGSSSLTISSYSYDAVTSITRFEVSTPHRFTTPLRGTTVTITGLTGTLASEINGVSYEVYSIPTTTSFTIKKAFGVPVKQTSRTNGVATLTIDSHKLACGQFIAVYGAGTDPIDGSTYDGTYQITANSATTIKYNNMPRINATINSMYIPPATASACGIVYITSAAHGFSKGQALTGTVNSTANSIISYISYIGSTSDSILGTGAVTGTDALIVPASSVANIYSAGMKLDVYVPTTSVIKAQTVTVYPLTLSYAASWGTYNTQSSTLTFRSTTKIDFGTGTDYTTGTFSKVPIAIAGPYVPTKISSLTSLDGLYYTSSATGNHYYSYNLSLGSEIYRSGSTDVPTTKCEVTITIPAVNVSYGGNSTGSAITYIAADSNAFKVKNLNKNRSYNFIYSNSATYLNTGSSVASFNFEKSTSGISVNQKIGIFDRYNNLTGGILDVCKIWDVVSPGAVFKGTVAGTTLTVTSLTSGKIVVGQYIYDAAATGNSDRKIIQCFITGFISGTNGGVGTYSISGASQTVSTAVTITGGFSITTSDSSLITYLNSKVNSIREAIIYAEFYPFTAITSSKTSFPFSKTYTSVGISSVINSTAFNLPVVPKDLAVGFDGNYGNSSSPIPVLTGTTLTYNSDRALATAPSGALVGAASISTTSVTGVSAYTNFSSYVEIANSSSAIKVTPTTFYIGNTSANLYSNSSFLSITSPTSIFEVGPSSLIIAQTDENGKPTFADKTYFAVTSTGTYLGNGFKGTYFDGAGNQWLKGSSITIGTETSNVYVDDYNIQISSDGSLSTVNNSLVSFSGNLEITGPFSVQGTYGNEGDILYSDGKFSYWGPLSVNTDIDYNFSNNITFSNTVNLSNTTINGTSIFNNDVTLNGASLYLNDYTNPDYFNYFKVDVQRLSITNTIDFSDINYSEFSSNSLFIFSNSANFAIGNSTVFSTVNSSAVFSSGNVIISNTIVANNLGGNSGQVLTANGVGGIYWATPVNSVFDGGTPFTSYINSAKLDAGGVN